MAQTIKRPFKTFNGVDWDTHYFENIASQVKMDDGIDLQTAIKNTSKSSIALSGSLSYAEGYANTINLSQDGIATVSFGVRYYITNSNGLTTGKALFVLPVGLRPKADMVIPVFVYRVGDYPNSIGYLYVRSNGEATLSLISEQTAYSQVCGSFSFSTI